MYSILKLSPSFVGKHIRVVDTYHEFDGVMTNLGASYNVIEERLMSEPLPTETVYLTGITVHFLNGSFAVSKDAVFEVLDI